MNENTDIRNRITTHPCYNESAHRKFARMHIPVAPKCNIQCNYCNRKYDCMNESRPGVTSEVLSPDEAVEKIKWVKEKIPSLTVIGIAGPGDPLANEQTFRALEKVHDEFPELTLCLSTNGLNLPKYVERLKELDVQFLTVTVNAVDPTIGEKIYDFIMWEGKKIEGRRAAEILIKNQLEGIERAVKLGMCVKVNTVFIPEINGDHIPEIARKVRELGAYISNIIPLIPVPGTKFENMRPPTPKERRELQELCEVYIRQMRHCKMCRADAIGLLGEDRSAEFTALCGSAGQTRPAKFEMIRKDSYRIAVASSTGDEVDRHFGHANSFYLFDIEKGSIIQRGSIEVENYDEIPMYGRMHSEKLQRMVESLKGIDVVIAVDFGERALAELRKHRIAALKSQGDIIRAVKTTTEYLDQERYDIFE